MQRALSALEETCYYELISVNSLLPWAKLSHDRTLVAAMQQIADWLKKLGMAEYAERFVENRIDLSVLPDLTDQDLEKMGVLLGDRRKMLRAIRDIGTTSVAVAAPSPPVETQPTQRDEAERRQLAVMFCDLVGSTALSARLDPEDLRGVIGAYHRCCTELVERNGGFVAKYMGDGVLAYFGYPQAHEHDAERAVRVGLGLVEAVPKLATHAGSPLQVRVGIATGLVVVGDLIGAGAAQEQSVVGETPNLAARLQTLADPGAVVIASSTRRLTGGLFEYRDLGAFELKGFAENVPAWQVLREGAAESRFEALRATTTPLVGRDEEIELLMRRWEQAKRGEGCIVLISGEPGIGKSRVAQTVLERISTEPHTRLRYFCSPHHQDSALYPSIAQLERAAGLRRDDTDEQRLAKLEKVLAQGTNDLSEAVPLLADLLSIPTGDRYPPLNLTAQKRKEKTLHAQLAQIEGLAAQQPVLMVWEDIHWSDPTTRESLDLLVDRVPTLRVLVIITFRPEFAPPWVGRPHVTMLTLNRLTPRQRAEMIAYVTGGKTLPREIAEQIVDRTDGVPLFIEELTKTVVESGILTEAGDHYAVAGPVAPLAIPASLHASLLARLDRLAPTREVAQIGSALGRSFSHELIVAVAQMPQQRIDGALEQLVSAELIFRRGTAPDAEYTFKHALVQDAAYSTLLRNRRQQIHARIASTLEGQFPEVVAAQPQVMAQHCGKAGLNEKAVGYWLKAGQQAVARSAMVEAVSQLRMGLDLLAGMPENALRREQELDLQIALGPALMATQGYAALVVGETIARARTLAEQLDRSGSLVALLYGQSMYHLIRSEHRLALSVAEQMERVGETQNDLAVVLLGRYIDATARYSLGEFAVARAVHEGCYGLRDPAHRATYAGVTAEDPYAGMLAMLAVTLGHLGHLEQMRLRSDEALSEARRLEHPYTLCFVTGLACWARWPAGFYQEALRHAEALVSLSNEHGFPLWLAWGTVHSGWSLIGLGRVQEGLALLTRGLPMVSATEQLHSVAWTLMLQADAYAKLGRLTDSMRCLAEAEQIIEKTNERCELADLYRLRGDLLVAIDDRLAAEENYRRALVVAKQQSARPFELRAATSLARLWRDQGKRTEARDLLAPVYGWFTEGFDTPVLQDAKALFDQLV
jgi:class 3 adenylate cyclase/tetratricopeptide (TPR) repeat protein